MTKFVGAEYVIANMLIKKLQDGQKCVSITELSKCGVEVQRISREKENLDAVFLTSRSEFYRAIYDFSDYFQCQYNEDHQLIGIEINQRKEIDDLEERFVGCIPQDIVDILIRAINQTAA